jgi:hypothetical protein
MIDIYICICIHIYVCVFVCVCVCACVRVCVQVMRMCYKCVHMLLLVCPHTATNVSSHWY